MRARRSILAGMTTSPGSSERPRLENWQFPPQNRWGFWHVREIVPTERIRRGDGPIRELPRNERELDGLTFTHEGAAVTFAEMLATTYTDAIVVVHHGEIACEWYGPEGAPDQPHLLMSVSKSLTSALVGALVDAGELDTEAEVTSIIPRLKDSSFEGATVQQLLDMRTGTDFDESNYDDRDADVWRYDEVCGLSARVHDGLPPDVGTFIEQVRNVRVHGEPFEYRSVLTDLLGWVAAEAGGGRFAELFSRFIWSKLGAEYDAAVALDPAGFSVVNGGICTTARDLARFGLLYLDNGVIGDQRVLSESWVERLREPSPELIAAFAPSHAPDVPSPDAFYHDCWWIRDAAAGIYAAEGIHGQEVFVHAPSRTVIAKFSTWPRGWDDGFAALTESGLLAVCDALGQDRRELG